MQDFAEFLFFHVPVSRDVKFNDCMDRYAALAPLYYRGAAVAVIVYDITSPESFTKAQYWVKVRLCWLFFPLSFLDIYYSIILLVGRLCLVLILVVRVLEK